MAIESVVETTTVPTIEIPARFVLDVSEGTFELSCLLSGAEAILSILSERLNKDTADHNAVDAVWRIVRSCAEKSWSLQWGYGEDSRAKKALGIEEA